MTKMQPSKFVISKDSNQCMFRLQDINYNTTFKAHPLSHIITNVTPL